MFICTRGVIVCLAIGMLSFSAYAEDVSKEQLKSLDEQVQEIKADTLNLAVQMRLLEEKLLYPSTTQVAVYVSLDDAQKFRPDSIEIQLDGKLVAQHLYTVRELEALQKGGLQRIYVGNITSGDHVLQVLVIGKTASSSGVRRKGTFKFRKDAGPRLLEVRLAEPDAGMISLRD